MVKYYSFIALMFSALLMTGCVKPTMAPENGAVKDDAMMEDDSAMVELPDIIKIGYIGPLTGNAAAYGQDVKLGVELYFSENPTIAEKPVEVIYEDSKCNGADAANATQKLITADKVQVIIGGSCSGETLAAAPIAEQNKVVILSPLSSSPELTTAGDYVFRNYPSDDKVAKTMVDHVLAHQQKVALLTEQTDYAQGYRGAIKKHVESAGKSDVLVVDEAFSVDNTDFRTLLTKVKESGADALIAIVQTPVTGGFVTKQAKELGLEIQIYSGDALPGPDFFSTAKDAAEGVKVVMVVEDPSRAGYAEKSEKVAGKTQGSDLFFAFGYDAAAITAMAIQKNGYDGTAIKSYFNTMPTYKGIASDITFDENGDNAVAAGVKVSKEGEFVLLAE